MRLFDFSRLRKRRRLARKGFSKTAKIRRTELSTAMWPAWWGHDAAVPLLVAAVVWLTMSLGLVHRRSFPAFTYVAGQIADRSIESEVPFEYEDLAQTGRLRQRASNQASPVYRLDHKPTEATLADVEHLRTLIQLRAAQSVPGAVAESPLSAQTVQLVRELDAPRLQALEYLFASRERTRLLVTLVQDAMEQGIIGESEVHALRDPAATEYILVAEAGERHDRQRRLTAATVPTPTEAAQKVADDMRRQFPENAGPAHSALVLLLPQVLRPSLSYDFQASQDARRRVARDVQSVTRVVPAGVILVRRGERITTENLARLERHQQELRQHRLHEDSLHRFLLPVVGLLLVVAAAYVLRVICPNLRHNPRDTALIGTVLIVQILVARGMADLYILRWNSAFLLATTLPLTLGAMLLAPLVGVRAAVWGGAFTSMAVAFQGEPSLHVFLLGALSSCVGAALMRRARKRHHAFRTGLGVGGTVFVVQTLYLLQNQIPTSFLPTILGLALLNGVITSMVASSILPLFEMLFGVTTDVSLLELSDLNHPLLKRLQIEAPGTYHHSLMVATLAEQAAEAVGANPLLARVGAYFHDIGKLMHPEYFSENIHDADPHAELQPRMSSLIILNHVKEGVDLALKHKLQKPIREAIAQHHGTNLVYFFYHRAIEKRHGDGSDVGEHDYRYPGPLPTRKEIVLISIADSCEAAARSIEKPTPQKIHALVDELVLKRIRDHQLDRADLTLAELDTAKAAIIKALCTMLHGRVRYPKELENEADLFKAAAQAAARKSDATAQGHPGRG